MEEGRRDDSASGPNPSVDPAPEVPTAGQLNPNLRICLSCSREISKQAASCPGCGHQFKKPGGFNPGGDPVHFIALIGLILLTILFVIGLSV